MKISKLFVVIVLLSPVLRAQETTSINPIRRNTIYGEVFGQGFFGSLNYDRLFNVDKHVMNSFSAGFIFAPKSAGFGDGMYLGVPVSYNWLFGKSSHHLELGLGFTFMATQGFASNRFENFYTYLTPKVGYRYQRPGGGFFFKAAFTPMIGLMNVDTNGPGVPGTVTLFKNAAGVGNGVFPWLGLSIGYSF